MQQAAPLTSPAHAWVYLTQAEVRFLGAAVAHLIPADELGPGALEADVVVFIDRQLQSAWGMHGRNYRLGPWLEGTPQQGYQSRLTPQEVYRAGVREINQHCIASQGKAFQFLAPAAQEQVLKDLEADVLELPSMRGSLFFNLLLRNTMEGFFADPMYGGNRDKAGWRLIGFPGVAASSYPEHLLTHNVRYEVEPVSILDIEQGRAAVDAQGYATHVMLKPGSDR